MHLEKNRSYACTFPVQRRKINVVEVRFTMRYSSRKLSNDKVVTTACNFWRQITCSFQVMSGNILFLGKKIFEISPFFLDLGKKKIHACTLRFSALNLQRILHKDLTRFHSWLQTSLFWLRDVVMRKKEGHCRGGEWLAFCRVFLEYDKIKQAKEMLCSQGAFPGEEFTTIRNIVEAVIC